MLRRSSANLQSFPNFDVQNINSEIPCYFVENVLEFK